MKKLLVLLLVLLSFSFSLYVEDSNFKPDFLMNVAMGNVEGASAINKFGHNTEATDGEDVWGGGGLYGFYPVTAQVMVISSSVASDDVGDTGATTVMVFGLDDDMLEISETVTLNGTSAVTLNNTYRRMYRGIVMTAGSNETNIGDIVVKTLGVGTVGLFIGAGDGQTQQAIYTIPAGKTGFFIKGYVGLADDDKNGEVAEFQWKLRPNNGTTGAWAVKGEIGLNNIGSSHWAYEYGIPVGGIPEQSDIKLFVLDTTATLGVVGGFDLILFDNDIWNL